MSAQTDTVRRVLALFNELPADEKARREHPALAQLLALMDPEVQFVGPAGQPDRSWEGRAGREGPAQGQHLLLPSRESARLLPGTM